MKDELEQQSQPSQQKRESAHRRKRGSVMVYLVILFATAFLLLLMSYFMQQRANEQTTDALKQSVSAVDALQKLLEDNDSLRAQVEDLKQQVAELTEANRSLEQSNQDYVYSAVTRRQELAAMDLFWQIDEAYVLGRYSLCRELIEQMETQTDYLPLKDLLPTESTTDNGRFSPAGRYQEIYDALY